MPDDVRAYMEPRFGADFSSVRLHTDSQSAQMNRGIQAKAFTHGSDIHFGAGQYDPRSSSGKRLLAHELTHTIQQTGGATPPDKIQRQVDTMGGTWTARSYEPYIPHGNAWGCTIDLEFEPNDLVNSKKIALIQHLGDTIAVIWIGHG